MKKRILAATAVCLLICSILCGCKESGTRLPDVSYDNAPVEAYLYEVNDGEIEITGYNAQNTVANIPSELEGKPVTTIKAGAFKGNGVLDTVNLPETITTIENTAFAGCSNLRAVSLPTALLSIGDDAFYGCATLTSLHFPYNLNHLGTRAFSGCSKLETIAFPDDAMYIGADAFAGTPWLAKQAREFVIQNGSLLAYNGSREIVTVPLDVRVISAAFSGNETVKKIILPDTVTHLTADAFSGCTSLTTITLGSGLQVVEDAAFSGCTSLTEISFPKAIKAIGKNAFAGCDALAVIKGKKNTAAEEFAKAKELDFEIS